MVRAIVLAAGASSRMGRAKAVLPLGPTGETVLSRVIRGLVAGGVPDVTVVAGAHIDAVRSAMPSSGAYQRFRQYEQRRSDNVLGVPAIRLVEHRGWERGQLSSLVAGLDAVADPQLEAILVTLVDVPLVRPDTVAAVVRAWRSSRAPITRPVDGDRHGHPVIFDQSVFAELRAADPRIGAKEVFTTHRERILDVPVKDEGAFTDLDTPEDYERAQRLTQS